MKVGLFIDNVDVLLGDDIRVGLRLNVIVHDKGQVGDIEGL